MQRIYAIAILLVMALLMPSYQAKRRSFHHDDDDDATNSDEVQRFMRGDIDPVCTAKCYQWWRCRIGGLFTKKCDEPSGCDCSKFAWER